MDELDLKIVMLLFINSRMSYREIASHLGLSVNAIYKRVQSLIELKIIQEFTAKIKPYAVNAIYSFNFGKSESQDLNLVTSNLAEHEDTSHIMVSSRNFIYVGAMLRNIHELDDYTSFFSKTANITSPFIGLLHKVYSISPIPYIFPKSGLNIDKLDKAIIRSMHHDSRKPISEIADEVNSTPSTVRRRLDRMIKEGQIELSINFNPISSNDIFTLFQVYLKPSVNKDELAKKLIEKYRPNIFFIWIFSNLPNLLVCWVWVNNMKELNDIMQNLKKERVESVISDIIYSGTFLDTWKEKLLYE